MKNKKIMPMILLNIILILGITSFGIAWFTLKTSATSNLILNTGSIDTIVERSRWILHSKSSSEVTNKNAENDFNNVKPGDAFIKALTIKNTGSLRQKITFEINEDLPGNLNNAFTISRRNQLPIILEPNQSKEVALLRLVLQKGTTSNNFQNKDINLSTIDDANFIKIKTTQVNVPRENILRFVGFSDLLIVDLKFDFLEGTIKATSSGNQAHHYFGNNEYIGFEIKDDKENTKIKLSIKGNDNANNFANVLNNFKFNTGDKIIIYATELNRSLISKDNGENFKYFSRIGGHRATKILKVSNNGLEEIN